MPTTLATFVLFAIRATLTDPTLPGARHFARPAGSYVPAFRDIGTRDGLTVEGAFTYSALCAACGPETREITKEVREAGASFGACRYFRVRLDGGRVAACALDTLTAEQAASVRVVPGHHGGWELQSNEIGFRETNDATIVVGDAIDPFKDPTEQTARVFTWFPGDPTPPVNLALATVKLI